MNTIDEPPYFPMHRDLSCPFDPPPGLKAAQEEAPLVRVRLWSGDTPWLVTRFAEQRALLTDPRLSSNPRLPGYPAPGPMGEESGDEPSGFLLMDNPQHARLRRMVSGRFSIKQVTAMRPAVQRIVDDLIDELLAGPNPADLIESFALPVPSLVICHFLGVPPEGYDRFRVASGRMVSTSVPDDERGAAFMELYTYMGELIDERLAEPADDLLSGLAGQVRAGELTRNGAATMANLLLISGHEFTASLIALGTLVLLENPDQLALVRDCDDPRRLAGAVEELLRYLNVAQNGRRRVATEDIDIAGHTIKAGEGVVLPSDIGNRDPRVFTDPDVLDVTRESHRHIAFGFGVHQCIGQSLTRMELRIVFSTLYRRIPTLALDTPIESLSFKHDQSAYGLHALPVRW